MTRADAAGARQRSLRAAQAVSGALFTFAAFLGLAVVYARLSPVLVVVLATLAGWLLAL